MSGAAPQESIAVIGMAGRFPDAADVAGFWRNLLAGTCSLRQLTPEELDAVDPATRTHPNFVPVAATVSDVELWDAGFFGYNPRDAELTDPQHRLFLECCWQAMEHAGYDPAGYPGVAGVVGGCGFPTYLSNNIGGHQDIIDEVGHLQLAMGNDRDTLTTMVSYKLNLRGPSFAVQTSCSTSLVAVHLACASLLSYESDLMLAGGVAIQSPQASGYVYEEGGIAAPDGVCRSLDAKGQGGVFGNGVGVVVLKRTEDALRDGDQIYAVILGTATNNDGLVRAGFAAPGQRGQAEVIAEALANADASADTIGYVEAHGTGTTLGDAVELAAVSTAFLPRDPAAGACAIGSAKANIGHVDRASGVIGLIKASLILHHGVIPPQINYATPNPALDTSPGAFQVHTTSVAWPPGPVPRRALVNSFGMGGTNAAAVLQEAPARHRPADQATSGPHLLVLSARSPHALAAASANLASHLREHPEVELADVAFTLQVGRAQFTHRRIVLAGDVAEAADQLDRPLDAVPHLVSQVRRSRPVVFLVPDDGIGGPPPDLAPWRALHAAQPAFREAFDQAVTAVGHTPAQAWAWPTGLPLLRYALGRLLARLGCAADRVIGAGRGGWVTACLRDEAALAALADAGPPAGQPPDLVALAADRDTIVVELGDGRLLRTIDPGRGVDDAWFAALTTGPAELVGRLWLAGAAVNWASAHRAHQPRRVALPTYPFERRRVWVDPAPAHARPRRSEQRHHDIGRWFYAPVWRQAARLTPPDLDARLVEAGPWLVVGADDPLCQALVDRLRAAGADVAHGTEAEAASPARTVLHAGALDAGPAHAVGTGWLGDFDRAQRVGFDSLRELVGTLAARPSADPVRVLVLTRAGARVGAADPVNPAHAGLVGLVRVLAQEHPGLRCRLVDVAGGPTDQRVTEAVLADATEPDVASLAYRDGQRWRQDHDELPLPAGPTRLRHGGSYLITGGLGNVCLALADHLATCYQARIALLARTPLPAEHRWDDWLAAHPAEDRTSSRIRRVRALRSAGASVLVVTADVAEVDQVASAVAEVRAEFGEIHGVIHGAGVQDQDCFGLSHELPEDRCRVHFRAKLFGLAALAEVLDLDRLDFCVTLSSLSAVLGGIGHGPYAAANAAMDALAHQLFAAGHRTVLTVDWDTWPGGVDMNALGGAATVSKYQMSYAEGAQALERALGAVGALPQLVNSTGDLTVRLATWVTDQHTDATEPAGDRHPRPPLATPFVPPADELETAVAAVWQDVLGLTGIGVLDDFFELGGHSLMAVRLIGRLRKSLGVNLPLAVLLECTTVRGLADRVRSLGAPTGASPTGGVR